MPLPKIVLLLAIAMFCAMEISVAEGQADLLTPELRQWVDERGGVFTVSSSDGFRPYSFIGDDGQISGIGGDYLALFEERLGIEFELRRFEKFADMLEAAKAREVDIIPFVAVAENRRSYLNFTQTFYRIQDRIIMRDDVSSFSGLDDLEGMRVGFIEGYVLEEALAVRRSQFEIVPLPSELVGIRELSVGRIDALIADMGAASYYVEQEGITNLKVVGDLAYNDAQTFGSRSDWPELNEILNIGLASITEDERAEIRRRWVVLEGVDPDILDRLWTQLVGVVTVGLSLALATIVWVASLRRLVARRTADLESEFAERRRVEAERQRLAAAMEQTAEFVLIVGAEGIVEYANPAFLRLNGATDLSGMRFDAIVVDSDRPVLQQALAEARDGDVWRGRVHLVALDGNAVHAAMTVTPTRDESATGGAREFVATGRDIRHEEELEARLRHGEKLSALGTMASGIAHDFNNLLTPIVGHSDLLRDAVSSSGTESLDAISGAASRAQQLVQQILSFSRLSEGEKVALDLTSEVAEGLSFLRSLLPTTVHIHSNLSDGQTVVGDRAQISQVLLNLGTNACDAMDAQTGRIEVSLDGYAVTAADKDSLPELVPGEYCRLTVLDDGKGMTADQQARIFDPYFTDKPYGKGTGLGLSTVHGIVQSHGGAIRVTSAPGEGTKMEVLFPSASEGKSTQSQPSSLDDMPRGNGQKVLLVDDDNSVLGVVGSMLEQLGYEVAAHSSPRDALATVSNSPQSFDVVLTDLTMPKMTGSQLASEVQAILPDMPVILMTGNLDLIDGTSMTCIGKPFGIRELADCLSRVW